MIVKPWTTAFFFCVFADVHTCNCSETHFFSTAISPAALQESGKASLVQTSAGEQRKEALADLQTLMRSIGPTVSLEGLRPGAEHAAFCPSLHALLEAALRLSDPRRGPVLRTMLSSG
jgi:hypothetical protein